MLEESTAEALSLVLSVNVETPEANGRGGSGWLRADFASISLSETVSEELADGTTFVH